MGINNDHNYNKWENYTTEYLKKKLDDIKFQSNNFLKTKNVALEEEEIKSELNKREVLVSNN